MDEHGTPSNADLLRKAREAKKKKQPNGRTPDWRERKVNGSPVPSMHNARLAITAMGVDCSFDTFHDKMLFGYEDDRTRTPSNRS